MSLNFFTVITKSNQKIKVKLNKAQKGRTFKQLNFLKIKSLGLFRLNLPNTLNMVTNILHVLQQGMFV